MYPQIQQSSRRVRVSRRNPNADLLGYDPEDDAPSELFQLLVEAFPQFQKTSDLIEFEAFRDNAGLEEFLSYAKKMGARIQRFRGEPADVKIIDYTKPSADEILNSSFVECGLFDTLWGHVNETGVGFGLGFSSKQLTKYSKRDFGAVPNLYHLIGVRGAVKDDLEKAKLKALDLVTLPTDLKGGKWPEKVEPISLIWSSVLIGAVANGVHQTKRGATIVDGLELRPRLKYSSPLPDVDVALSHEIFGPREYYRRIVFSSRARSILQELGMNLECVPVMTPG